MVYLLESTTTPWRDSILWCQLADQTHVSKIPSSPKYLFRYAFVLVLTNLEAQGYFWKIKVTKTRSSFSMTTQALINLDGRSKEMLKEIQSMSSMYGNTLFRYWLLKNINVSASYQGSWPKSVNKLVVFINCVKLCPRLIWSPLLLSSVHYLTTWNQALGPISMWKRENILSWPTSARSNQYLTTLWFE